MIAIKVAGEYFDLPKDARIRLRMPSQVFATDFVSQGYSYPISLPYTPTNQRLMRHYDRINNTASFDEIPCSIELGGSHWRKAVVKYRGFKNGAYDVDLQVPDDQAVLDLRGLTTLDIDTEYDISIDWGSADMNAMNAIFTARLGTVEETDFIFAPIRNTGIFGDRDRRYFYTIPAEDPQFAPTYDYVNHYDKTRAETFLRYTLGSGEPDRWVNHFVPLPYLVRVVEELLARVGLSLGGDVFRNEEVRTQVVLNNGHLFAGVAEDGSAAIPFSDVGDPVYGTLYLRHMLPELPLVDLLLRVCRRYNAVPLFRRGRVLEVRSRTDILNSNVYTDITKYVVPSRDVEMEESNGLELTETEDRTDTARLDEAYDPARITATVRTPADLGSGSNGDLKVVEVENRVYKRAGVEWVPLADLLPEVTVGSDPESTDAGVGFVSMYRGEDELTPGREWLVPNVEQRLADNNVDVHLLGPYPLDTLRLLFYRGMQEDSNGDTYPLLSNDVYNYAGDVLPLATMREALDGAGGIYERWYASWQRAFARARVAPKRVRLPLHMLRNFQWDRKLMIDGTLYLCREIDVEFTTTGMGIPLLDLVRLPTNITGVRLPISCAGRGHSTIVYGGTTMTLVWQTDTGYLSWRGIDGVLHTVGDGNPATVSGTTITLADDADKPVCVFSSNVDGQSTGDITYLLPSTVLGGLVSLSTNYLQDLYYLDLASVDTEQMVVGLDLTNNAVLYELQLGAYAFETLDLSGCDGLGVLAAVGSALTSVTWGTHPLLTNVDLSDCHLDAATVDALFNMLDAVGAVAGVYNVSGGTNAAPTAASDTARTNLAGSGNTLIHN